MVTRTRKIEIHFENSVREEAESLLQLLAPDELINWGALKYRGVLDYLRTQLSAEIAEIDSQKEQ